MPSASMVNVKPFLFLYISESADFIKESDILFLCNITTSHPVFYTYIGAIPKEVLAMGTVFKILKATGTVAAKLIIWLAGKLEGGK